MKNDSYYIVFNIVDRINDEIIKKFRAGWRFSEYIKKSRQYWNVIYSRASIGPKNLIMLAEALDLSVEYLITGKNRGPYIPVKIDYTRLFAEHKKLTRIHHQDGGRFSNSIAACICKTKKKGHILSFKTLFALEEELRIPIYKLGFMEI